MASFCVKPLEKMDAVLYNKTRERNHVLTQMKEVFPMDTENVIIETSARHVHLTQEHLEILFGKGFELHVKKELSQPGQFASEEKVRVEGTKSAFPAVSGAVKLVGPCGSVELTEGVIAAKRHIHTTPEEAQALGVADKDIVSVQIDGPRALTFDEVVVRVSPKFVHRMHVDTDEAQAAGLTGETIGKIIVHK